MVIATGVDNVDEDTFVEGISVFLRTKRVVVATGTKTWPVNVVEKLAAGNYPIEVVDCPTYEPEQSVEILRGHVCTEGEGLGQHD